MIKAKKGRGLGGMRCVTRGVYIYVCRRGGGRPAGRLACKQAKAKQSNSDPTGVRGFGGMKPYVPAGPMLAAIKYRSVASRGSYPSYAKLAS